MLSLLFIWNTFIIKILPLKGLVIPVTGLICVFVIVHDCVSVRLWASVCIDKACVSHMTDNNGVSAISGWWYGARTSFISQTVCVRSQSAD